MKRRFKIAIASLVAMPVVALGVLAFAHQFDYKPLPKMGTVPTFSLTERSGHAYGSSDLDGKVWIASFIFTHCTAQCPMIINRLQAIQKELRFKASFRIVSFTTDPKRDTPETLRQYALRAGADPYKWLFLTGRYDSIQQLSRFGFHLAALNEGGGDIVHSAKLVLVDPSRRIRGYYDSQDPAEMKQLLADTQRLLTGTYN